MNYNTNTTLSNVTGNNLSGEMKTFYDKSLIHFARPKLVHAQFGQKKDIPKNNGKTIQFRKFSPLPKALMPLEEGVTPDGNHLNVTTVTSTVEQYGDYITTSDMLNLTATDRIITEAQAVLGDQAGRTLDTVIREKINAGTNVQYGSGKSDRSLLVGGKDVYEQNDYMNVETVKKAVATLKRNNASPFKNGNYIAIIHPDVANDLTNDPEWKAVKQNVDPKDFYEGAIGKIYGVVFVESTEAKIFRANALTSIGDGTLTVKAISGSKVTVKETLESTEVTALSGKSILIEDMDYTISSAAVNSDDELVLTLNEAVNTSIAGVNSIIYPGGSASGARDVYSTLFIGQNAYGVTNVNGGGLETIIKQKGSAGTGDPLDQRSTIGWKATQTAEILSPEFMVRVETTCSF